MKEENSEMSLKSAKYMLEAYKDFLESRNLSNAFQIFLTRRLSQKVDFDIHDMKIYGQDSVIQVKDPTKF